MTGETIREIQCPECNGFGRIGDGPFTIGMECPPCTGSGVRLISVTTEEAVRKVLKKTSEQTERKHTEHLVYMLTLTIDGPDALVTFGESEGIKPSSLAAVKARGYLWDCYPAQTSDRAVCDLYYSLGRQSELGWLEEGLPDYRFEG